MHLAEVSLLAPELREAAQRSAAGEAIERVMHRIAALAPVDGARDPFERVLRETVFHERTRLESEVGPRCAADRRFIARLATNVVAGPPGTASALTRRVLVRYTDEIRGRFDPLAYLAATRMVPAGLRAVLHGPSPIWPAAAWSDVDENLIVEGATDALRSLTARGAVVLAPTHVSNLDSIVLGFAIFRLGLPPFAYGAGLNLFSIPVLGAFMSRLGAYTIDRRKTDPLYRSVLKEFATVLLERGQHGLFFPGGTRRRSGAIESRLKKGLLGTALEAFKNKARSGHPRPCNYVFPVTVNYPLVFEAKHLVTEYLSRSRRDDPMLEPRGNGGVGSWSVFLRRLFGAKLRLRVVVGKPLDPFGNDVDGGGASTDPRGRGIDPTRYLQVAGALTDDPERDAEFTCGLEQRILQAYREDTVVMPTHVLAFALFEVVRKGCGKLELPRLFERLDLASGGDWPIAEVAREVSEVLRELRALASAGRIRLDDGLANTVTVLGRGVEIFRELHQPPVLVRRRDCLRVRDGRLLFYYRNRLDALGLRAAPRWVVEEPP